MKRSLFVVFIMAFLLLAACTTNEPEATFTDVSPAELQTMLADKDFVMVNVHIPFQGDLPDTDSSIPFNTISQNLDQLPGDKDAKIVLYCRSGSMSTTAAQELVDLGYTNVINLAGGFNAWQAAGLSMDQ